MHALITLWMPILLSAVLVFVVSSIIHMALPWHKNDYPRVPNEERAREAIRALAIPPGDYMMPRCESRAEMGSPEFAEKVKQGPNVILTVIPDGPRPMGKYLVQWFLYAVVVNALAGWIAGRVLPRGAEYLEVFKLVAATAFMGYVVALWQMSVWYHRAWSATIKATVDGLIYALITAGTFGWLWPKLAV